MQASDIMSSRVVSVAPEATVLDAIKLMLDNHISGLPVIDKARALSSASSPKAISCAASRPAPSASAGAGWSS
jgi:CBS domain-containing protein